MAKLYSLTKIVMPDGSIVPRRTVFDATPTQAKQFDKLGAARPATAQEIAGTVDVSEPIVVDEPVSDARPAVEIPGDPQGVPKGKSAPEASS